MIRNDQHVLQHLCPRDTLVRLQSKQLKLDPREQTRLHDERCRGLAIAGAACEDLEWDKQPTCSVSVGPLYLEYVSSSGPVVVHALKQSGKQVPRMPPLQHFPII
jgi:hypothetical protein